VSEARDPALERRSRRVQRLRRSRELRQRCKGIARVVGRKHDLGRRLGGDVGPAFVRVAGEKADRPRTLAERGEDLGRRSPGRFEEGGRSHRAAIPQGGLRA